MAATGIWMSWRWVRRKIDHADLQTDVKKMIDAALTFNLPGTAPYREANKVYKHGLKHLNRARPLVLSPSPSPERQTSELPESSRGTPHPGRPRKLAVHNYIPEEMLPFPPNSLQAAAIGWNLTGGRRVRAKRFVRGREKFNGRWRDYCPDGSRDVAEMDDPQEIMDIWREKRGDEWKTVVDWRALCEGETRWWEWDGPGGSTGQPPLPGAPRLQRDPLPTKELGTLDFGDYPVINDEVAWLRRAPTGDLVPLEQQLVPDVPSPQRVPAGWPVQTFINVHDSGPPPAEFLANMTFGSVRGEAYVKSVQQFISGALKGAEERSAACDVKTEESGEPAINSEAMLWDYASHKWHNGVLHNDVSRAAQRAVKSLSERTPDAIAEAEDAYARLALGKLTSPMNPLNIQPLLREPSDFMYVGVGGKSGVNESLAWVGNEISRVIEERRSAKRDQLPNGDPAIVESGPASNKRSAEDVEGGDLKRVKVENARNGNDLAMPTQPAEPNAALAAVPTPVGAPATAEPSVSANGTASDPNPFAIVNPAVGSPAEAGKPLALGSDTPNATGTATPAAIDVEEGLRKLRLELVALTKFYPLACLRKMSKEDAARLLPANVRNLMTINPPNP